jgi:hypothetical protein
MSKININNLFRPEVLALSAYHVTDAAGFMSHSQAMETVIVLYCYLSICYVEINEEIRLFWLFFSIFHQKS